MKYIYILGGLFLIILPLITLNDLLEDYRVQRKGIEVEMIIKTIPGSCFGTKNKYFMRVEYLEKIYLKRIGSNFCERHSVGDKITLKYLEDSDKVMFPNESTLFEFISGVIMFILGLLLILLGSGFFPKIYKYLDRF